MCRTNSDIFFVSDSSGSIGSSNFDEVRGFVEEFVDDLTVGPNGNQVGVIIFSDTARVNFYLNSFPTHADLLTAIRNVEYNKGYTNTADGLCQCVG